MNYYTNHTSRPRGRAAQEAARQQWRRQPARQYSGHIFTGAAMRSLSDAEREAARFLAWSWVVGTALGGLCSLLLAWRDRRA